MSSDIPSIVVTLTAVLHAIQSSAFFTALVWFLGIYSIVLFADVVMLLFLRDIPGDLKKTLYGATRPMVSQSKFHRRWKGIGDRILTGNPSQYKAAILEADALAEEMLSGSGFDGANMGERLASIDDGQLLSLGDLREGHAIRNRIIQDPAFVLSKEEAEATLGWYRKFFEELELL